MHKKIKDITKERRRKKCIIAKIFKIFFFKGNVNEPINELYCDNTREKYRKVYVSYAAISRELKLILG